ncbi:MAG: SMP-30/gluconolactonase/LRE family protein [Rhizobiaceae bacterium]
MIGRALLTLLLLASGYLLLWPVPIDPIAWNAPSNAGYVDPFAPNTRMTDPKRISLGDLTGPEDIAISPAGFAYLPTHEGMILKYDPKTGDLSNFVNTKGRPLGIEFGPDNNLYVADAYQGLLSISPDGAITIVTNATNDGSKILYADDLDIARDGSVYFTDASTKFGARDNGGTLPASLLDLMEHGPNGRVLKFDPVTRQTTVLLDGLHFANGLALTQDERHALVVETGSYAIWKLSLEGTGQPTKIIDNLPGFPDNINRNGDGTFWVGLAAPRSAPVDALSNQPFLRKVVQRLPAFLRPAAQRYGLVFKIDQDGNVLETLQDPSGGFALTTGVVEAADGTLYISSLTEPDFAIVALD